MHIYINVPKYNLLSLYYDTYMHVFREDHLTLHNQLTRSSLRRAIFHAPSFTQLPVALWGWSLTGFSPCNLATLSVFSCLKSHLGGYVGNTLSINLLKLLRGTISQQSLSLCGFPLFSNFTWVLGMGVCYRCVQWNWGLQLCMLIGWVQSSVVFSAYWK